MPNPDPVATLPPTPPSDSPVADAPMLRHAFADTNGTLDCARQVASDVAHDLVPEAGHTFASDNPAWTAERLLRFFGHEGDKA